jgi:hypothetical protein
MAERYGEDGPNASSNNERRHRPKLGRGVSELKKGQTCGPAPFFSVKFYFSFFVTGTRSLQSSTTQTE